MGYYIEYDGGRDGPFDLLGIIRKIRNGSLKKHHSVSREDDLRLKPAYQHPELYDIFIEQDKMDQEKEDAGAWSVTSFGSLIKSGFSVLKEDQTAAVITGMLLLMLFFLVGISVKFFPPLLTGIFIPIVGYFSFSLCLVSILRVARGQLLSLRYLTEMLRLHGISLFIVSLFPAFIAFSVPWLLYDIIGAGAWGITIIAGLPIMAYCFYLPVLIADRGLTARQAFTLNHHVIASLGVELYAMVVGMLFINLAAISLIILPLLTLPVTLIGLMILYDHYFSEY
jgi:hypothetical protein